MTTGAWLSCWLPTPHCDCKWWTPALSPSPNGSTSARSQPSTAATSSLSHPPSAQGRTAQPAASRLIPGRPVVSYTCLQVGLYGALGPAAAAEAAAHLHVRAPWWAWAIITVRGQLRVDITGRSWASCSSRRSPSSPRRPSLGWPAQRASQLSYPLARQPHLSGMGQLQCPGCHRGAGVRRVRAAPGAGRGSA